MNPNSIWRLLIPLKIFGLVEIGIILSRKLVELYKKIVYNI